MISLLIWLITGASAIDASESKDEPTTRSEVGMVMHYTVPAASERTVTGIYVGKGDRVSVRAWPRTHYDDGTLIKAWVERGGDREEVSVRYYVPDFRPLGRAGEQTYWLEQNTAVVDGVSRSGPTGLDDKPAPPGALNPNTNLGRLLIAVQDSRNSSDGIRWIPWKDAEFFDEGQSFEAPNRGWIWLALNDEPGDYYQAGPQGREDNSGEIHVFVGVTGRFRQ